MDYKDKVGQLWLKRFKKAGAKEQWELDNLRHEAYPVGPARSQKPPFSEEKEGVEKTPLEMEKARERYKMKIRSRTA